MCARIHHMILSGWTGSSLAAWQCWHRSLQFMFQFNGTPHAIDQYVKNVLEKWGSAGLSVAAVRRTIGDTNSVLIAHWQVEVFSIASKSKLLLSMSLGFWFPTKISQRNARKRFKGLDSGIGFDGWGDGSRLQDMLSHPTGGLGVWIHCEKVGPNAVVLLVYRSDVWNHRCKRDFDDAVPSTFRWLSRKFPVQ